MIDRLTDIFSIFGAFLDSEAFWLVLLVFYPIYGLLYRRRSAMMAFVVAFSLLFAYKVGGLIALSVLVKAVVDYWLSVWLSHIRSRSRRRALLICSVLLSVGVLVWFKCDGGMMQSVASIVGANFRLTDIVVPVGISFYTFRSVSYMVDVYRGVIIAPRRMLDYVFYLTYFPVLVAGPIVRAAEFFPQLEGNRRITPPMLYAGLFLMMKGLLKKAVVADYLAQFNNLVFDNPAGYSGTETLLALLGYSAQIYLDFSGYSDIAIGMSRTLGIELPLNFRSPYKSVSITEFWRRWHISLSSWLRDYIYIPLGGSRCGRWRTRFNLLLTMAVGGAWHGAGFTFVVWGLAHGMALVVQKAFSPLVSRLRAPRQVWIAATFVFVTVMWLPFRCVSLADTAVMFCRIFTDFRPEVIEAFVRERAVWTLMLIAAYVLIFLPDRMSEWAERRFVGMRWFGKLLLLCLLLQLIIEFSAAYVAPFIYAGF